MPSRLPISVAQLNARNSSEKFKNCKKNFVQIKTLTKKNL